ncbi:MAG: FG-GAP repeat protein, partial [Phycisphaerales bacterium]
NDTPHDPGDDFWVQEDKLTPWDVTEGDLFGISVAIRGHRAIVGARDDDDAGSNSGSAYVFRHDDNDTPYDPTDDRWVREAKLTASDAAGGDRFGTSVSISGDRAVVGAQLDDDAGSHSGSSYVFRCDDNATPLDPSDDFWIQEDKLTASDAAGGDRFGVSVFISGDRIVVGAALDDDACLAEPTCDSGSAYVFRLDDNGTSSQATDDFWVQQAKLVASDMCEGDVFGASVTICGDQAIVGAHLDDDDRGEDSGSVYTFSIAGRCTDLLSFANLQNCFSGDGGGVLSGCQIFNFDGDNDVDLDDYHLLLLTLERL